MSPLTRTVLEIWEADDPNRMREMYEENLLLPLLLKLELNLDLAQDLRAEASNTRLATIEILQMAGVPLLLPTSTSASMTSSTHEDPDITSKTEGSETMLTGTQYQEWTAEEEAASKERMDDMMREISDGISEENEEPDLDKP